MLRTLKSREGSAVDLRGGNVRRRRSLPQVGRSEPEPKSKTPVCTRATRRDARDAAVELALHRDRFDDRNRPRLGVGFAWTTDPVGPPDGRVGMRVGNADADRFPPGVQFLDGSRRSRRSRSRRWARAARRRLRRTVRCKRYGAVHASDEHVEYVQDAVAFSREARHRWLERFGSCGHARLPFFRGKRVAWQKRWASADWHRLQASCRISLRFRKEA